MKECVRKSSSKKCVISKCVKHDIFFQIENKKLDALLNQSKFRHEVMHVFNNDNYISSMFVAW